MTTISAAKGGIKEIRMWAEVRRGSSGTYGEPGSVEDLGLIHYSNKSWFHRLLWRIKAWFRWLPTPD